MELSWASLARSPRSKDDSRTGHRLARLVDEQAATALRSSALFRVPLVQGLFQRHLGPVDESWHRPLPLLPGRELSGVRRGQRRYFRLAGRPGKSRYFPGTVHVFAGFASELLDELRQ